MPMDRVSINIFDILRYYIHISISLFHWAIHIFQLSTCDETTIVFNIGVKFKTMQENEFPTCQNPIS